MAERTDAASDATVIHVATAAPYDVLLGSGLLDRLPDLVGDRAERVGLVFPDDLLDLAASLPPRDRLRVVRDLLRGVLGEQPPREIVLSADDGRPFVYVLPPSVRDVLGHTPERAAELARRGTGTSGRPLREVIAKLESLGQG